MILKITDGSITHYLDGFSEVRCTEFSGFSEEDYGDSDKGYPDADGVDALHLFLAHEPSEPEPTERDVVILQPAMGPKCLKPRTIVTDYDVYLLNDNGKTVEVLHRAK